MCIRDRYNYEAIKPITLHFGAALLLKSVNFFYEGKQTDWSNLEFDSNEIVEQDGTPASILINEEIRNIYTSTTSHHFGTAIKLRDTPINLFSGYQYIPTPFNSVDEENINEVFSFKGPSNVIPASLDPKRKLPENLSVFGFF